MKKHFHRTYLLVVMALVLSQNADSQDNTMYLLHQVPQANILNPAVDFPCKFYIELPVISSIKAAYNNTSFTYKDFIRQGSGTRADSLIPDFDNIYPNLRKNNAIYAEFENVLAGIGFHFKKYFISARISQTHLAGLFYQKDFIALKDGNWDPITDLPVNFDLSGNEFNAISYMSFSISASKQLSNYIRIGARFSYLKGMINYSTSKSNLMINTTEQPFAVDIQSNFSSNASFPMEYETDADGRVHSIRPTTDNILGNYIFNKNRGISFDLGLVYDFSEQTSFSASILNLGFIRWKSNAYNLDAAASINLSGVDLEQYSNNQVTDLINLLKDTLIQSFHSYIDTDKYFTFTPVKIFAGASHQLNNKISLGLTGKLFLYNYATFSSITATLTIKPVSFFSISGSISYANRTLKNIGLAAIIGNNRVNFYLASDMLPINYVKDNQSGLIFPYQSRSINLRFGLNLMFGCGKYKKPFSNPVCPAYH